MAANSRFAMGVHALALLAAESDGSHTSDKIAQAIGTNPVVVRRVLASLRKAGLVSSQKGPSGGTRLAQSSKKITLADIYQAIEKRPVLPFPYNAVSGKDAGHRKTGGAVREAFDDANKVISRELTSISLAQIVKRSAKAKK